MFKKKNFFKKILTFLLVLISISPPAEASQSDRLKGYAWSDGAGWISFNCTNTGSCSVVDYGVTTDSSGNLSGYAWSDNLGWLSFHFSDMQGISGASQPKVDLNTGEFSGTAYFRAGGSVSDDGWLGLVDLSLASFPSNNPKINFSTYEVEGWAWGNINTGWISFNCSNDSSCGTSDYQVTYDPFFFEFSANDGTSESSKLDYNGDVTLYWTTVGASGPCTASNGTSSWRSPSSKVSNGSEIIYNLISDTTFSLTCQDSSGNSLTRDLKIWVKPPTPVVIFGADDTNIAYNTSTNLNWTVDHVSGCTISGPGNFTPAQSVSLGSNQSAPTGNLTALSNYFEITCSSDSIYPDETKSLYIYVEKLAVNLRSDKNPVPYGEKIKLYYSTEFPTSGTCVATGDVPDWAGSAIDESPGEHEFISGDTVGGQAYTATLTCDGSNSQQQSATVNLNVRNKPNYQEI